VFICVEYKNTWLVYVFSTQLVWMHMNIVEIIRFRFFSENRKEFKIETSCEKHKQRLKRATSTVD
jgi:hypothetical protein